MSRILNATITIGLYVSSVSSQMIAQQAYFGPEETSLVETHRDADALSILKTIAGALNPSALPTFTSLVLSGQVSRSATTSTFEENSSTLHNFTVSTTVVGQTMSQVQTVTPATSQTVFEDGSTVTVGDIRILESQPLLPLALLQEALNNNQIGVSPEQTGDGHIKLYLHTPFWIPGLVSVGTLGIDVYFDPTTSLISCEAMDFHYDADIRHAVPRQVCYSDYRLDQGWMVPHTITDVRAGMLYSTTTISQLAFNPTNSN